jgi:hypothetical protein
MRASIPIAVLCAVLVILPRAGVRAADDSPGLDEIILRLATWRGSFSRLRVVYERRNPGQLQKYQPALVQTGRLEDFHRRYELILTNTDWMHYETWDYMGHGAALQSHEAMGVNDRFRFDAVFHDSDGEVPDSLTVGTIWHNIGRRPTESMPLTELWIPSLVQGNQSQGAGWLPDALRANRPEILEYRELDGARCVALSWSSVVGQKLWLDLDHDCLPRLREPMSPVGENAGRFHVEEYRKMPNGHWFPARGTLRHGSDPEDETYHWVVTDISINDDIPLSRFSPPEPGPQTRVTDWTQRPGAFSERHGTKTARWFEFQLRNSTLFGLIFLGVLIAVLIWAARRK